MTRSLYVLLLRLHPRPFREQFADEMLWIFDQAGKDPSRARLLADAAVSLVRQWLLRPGLRGKPLAAGVTTSLQIEPFHSLDDEGPPPAALVHGGLVSVMLFLAVAFLATHGGGSIPAMVIGAFHPRPDVLAFDRASIEPAEPTTKVNIPERVDPWHDFASIYFLLVRVLAVLDTDKDLVLSPAEIATAPTALRWLDLNQDGKLSPEECGYDLGRSPQDGSQLHVDPRQLDSEFVRRTSRQFMRFHPVLAVLDANRSGQISATEIYFSVASLKALDRNRDGHLTAPELAPNPVASQTALYLSQLDSDNDGRISPEEASRGRSNQIHELLAHADRNQDGVVTKQELVREMQLREVSHPSIP